ncbi:uncharacterized, partial [Tachysurus ichikawai]
VIFTFRRSCGGEADQTPECLRAEEHQTGSDLMESHFALHKTADILRSFKASFHAMVEDGKTPRVGDGKRKKLEDTEETHWENMQVCRREKTRDQNGSRYLAVCAASSVYLLDDDHLAQTLTRS